MLKKYSQNSIFDKIRKFDALFWNIWRPDILMITWGFESVIMGLSSPKNSGVGEAPRLVYRAHFYAHKANYSILAHIWKNMQKLKIAQNEV